MDKREKFHQDKPMQDEQAQIISDDELETVSGGATRGYCCGGCYAVFSDFDALSDHLEKCPEAIAMRQNGRTR